MTRLYASIGLPVEIWKDVESMKSSLTLVDVLGRSPDTSEVIELLIKQGIGRYKTWDEQRQATLVR